jgi:hypothetical protein
LRVAADGCLVELPEQQATIEEILKLRREGFSLRGVASGIDGVASHVTVRTILESARAEAKDKAGR